MDELTGPYGYNPESPYQKRLTVFNLARGLFRYSHQSVDGDAKLVDIEEVLAAAKKIEEFLNV